MRRAVLSDMRTIERGDVDIEIILHLEETRPEDSFDDPETVQHVLAAIESGSDWAWCCVEVRATYDNGPTDISGSDFLGCCSYASRGDFKRGGYYGDMIDGALADLNQKIRILGKEIY